MKWFGFDRKLRSGKFRLLIHTQIENEMKLLSNNDSISLYDESNPLDKQIYKVTTTINSYSSDSLWEK